MKFPRLAKFDKNSLGAFQISLTERYPLFSEEKEMTFTASPQGVNSTQSPLWKFRDLSSSWTVVLSPEHLAIECTQYTEWADLHDRFKEALDSLSSIITVPARSRIGLRYVNHLDGATVAERLNLVAPDLLGFGSLRAAQASSAFLHAMSSHTVFRDGDNTLSVRSATGDELGLPDGVVIDLDCFSERASAFDPAEILELFSTYNDVLFRTFLECLSEDHRDRLINPEKFSEESQ